MIDTNFCNDLITVIRNCYFEPGKWTKADNLFLTRVYSKRLLGIYKEPFKELQYIVQNNINDTLVLEGVLHILSYYDEDYEKIKSCAISIIELCSTNTSAIIQDIILQCVENWNSSYFIPILKDMDMTENWLKEYKDDVIVKLQNNKE